MNLQSLAPRIFLPRGKSGQLLNNFWRWWSTEILYFVPPGIRKVLDHHERVLHVSVNDNDMTVELCHGKERQLLDSVGLDSSPTVHQLAYPETNKVVVELAPGQAISRQVSLPLGTEDRIANVLGYEMDRLTPFANDDVYFNYRVASRDANRQVIELKLVVALRETVDEILARLNAKGINPSAVTAHGALETPFQSAAYANLLPRDKRAIAASKRELLPKALTILALVLLALAVVYPIAHQKIRLNSLDDEINGLGPAVISADRTRSEIAEAVRQGGFIANRWTSMPTKIGLLSEITRIIPDDTWLARVQILGTTVRIHGESEGASSLIGLIEGSSLLSDVRFSSPVTKNPRTSNDRFEIEAKIKTEISGE
jgi:general secretion pathway protein L